MNFDNLPKTSGVYLLKKGRTILYIGKAQNIKLRVKSHFQQPSYRDDLFIQQVTHVSYIETPTEIDALLLESELIKKHLPKYNVMWRDDKNYSYAAITKERIPRVIITHQRANADLIGPFVDGRALKKVLRLLRKVFPYYTAKTHPAKKCSWCHLDRCPGPEPDMKKYRKDLRHLKAVLQGKRVSVVKQFERAMKKAAQAKKYEEAASLRDQFYALSRIAEHTKFAPWNIPRQGAVPKRIEGYDISNIQGTNATGSMVVFVDGKPAKEHYRKFKIRLPNEPNDFAMMQEVIARRLNHPEWPFPDLMVIDGGKGQLSSAMKSINASPTARNRVDVVALAKKHNELFYPGKKNAVLLTELSKEMQHAILHVRDESHRFALSYHRKLRKKNLLTLTEGI
jgi:excinuclease ABC subunit C